MRKWRRLIQNFFITHIAAFEEQQNSKGPYRPAADTRVIRSSLKRYFKYAGPDRLYVLVYDLIYEEAIEELREEGWIIRLEMDSYGELYFGVYAEKGEAFSRAGI